MKHWLSAARPRTLPLALASIFMGGFLAASVGKFDWLIFTLCCLTTIALQVLSNFANDYGDTQNGADLAGRVGPERAVQSGAITPKQMLNGIIFMVVLCLVLGISLLYFAFKDASKNDFLGFLGLGLISMLAAYTYTAGKKPYGYAGLGDVSVFIFFGLVGVLGSNYLFTKSFSWLNVLPAFSCGLFATGVLNINNIRDIESDTRAGKKTIPARLGKPKAIIYHWFLLSFGMISMLIFSYLQAASNYYYIICFPLFFINGIKVSRLPNPDPMLKQMALSTLVFVLSFGLSQILF
ncbi:1,4-dihydroxy-2-naphthoateoctaprenyltransferase [Emticicia oligotrophica DSM 17448]|uniref:1,4-dihydroxy-2-naphthoate octaprenyltransferase n=1 Tax=Emticicia oligotrophica (strain DSM 17448 / CIP 109782 / MTCC 6937 / GPTSA100-15) TaxID=929562 RepID=A0ABM5N592_EMTOG|nr:MULTISPECIES: 1,4-dihydroxy-2-naphthoate polyprenyltransferase [Emticicia]AFK04636.1 1,4-dihydroxy-2-naphthoateoctaprenyltransferase [Emticicia oligotrophica DSM 17448]